MTHMVGQTVDLRIKTRQPFVLAEQDRCVTRRQFARQRRLARRGFSANKVQRSHQPNLPPVDPFERVRALTRRRTSLTPERDRLIAISECPIINLQNYYRNLPRE